MADFSGLGMATGYQRLDGAKAGSERRTVGERVRCLSASALLVVATVALVTSGVCFWNQRKLELENGVLKEGIIVLESKIETVRVEMAKAKAEAYDESGDRSSNRFSSMRRRPRRSNRNGGEQKQQRKARDVPRAVNFQLDVERSTTTQLKWKIWTGAEAGTKRTDPKYLLNSAVRLSEDGTNVTIDETGLYFIYAQIHFENAKPRNAFAVQVDSSPIMKCFQSLDYFNRSLTLAENSRFKPCHSASTVVLHRNQVVSLVNLYPHRVYNDPLANFWGLVKLAD